jgi:hypothetical protein
VIATGLCQAQLLVLEKPGNALPSPISLPTQPNALRSRIDYYLLTPLSVRSLSKIAHIYRLIVPGRWQSSRSIGFHQGPRASLSAVRSCAQRQFERDWVILPDS